MALNDSAELLELIRLRGSIPSVAPDWTDAIVLAQASRELLSTHLPLLIAARGEYLVKKTETTLVSGTSRYRLPARCCAVRHVDLKRADGIEKPLEEANPADEGWRGANPAQPGTPSVFTFETHSLELWPIPTVAETLRVRWHIRPSRITTVANCARVTAIEPNTPSAGQTRLTFAAPSGSEWSAATKHDLVKSSSPFDIIGFDLTPLTSSSTTRVFTSTDLPVDLEVGDYLTPANFSCFPNVPVELHEPLALRTAATIVKPKGDGLADKLEAEATAKERQLLVGILAPRSKGNVKRIVSRRWW